MARYIKNPEALIARNTDIKRSEPVVTGLFFWNKKAIMKFLPVPSEMSKLEGTNGCIITQSPQTRLNCLLQSLIILQKTDFKYFALCV